MIQFAQFAFDNTTGCLYRLSDDGLCNSALSNDGSYSEVHLRHKVGALLSYLVENRDRVVSKDELLENLWLHGDYRDSALTQSIRDLRKVLGDKAQTPTFIRTFPQRGYQWIAPVTPIQLDHDSNAVRDPKADTGKHSEIDDFDEPIVLKKTQTTQITLDTEPSEKPTHISRTEHDSAAYNTAAHKPAALEKQRRDTAPIDILDNPSHIEPNQGNRSWFSNLSLWLPLIVIALSSLYLFSSEPQKNFRQMSSQPQQQQNQIEKKTNQIMVLPFSNGTEQRELNWVELGLSDMLSMVLRQRRNLGVIPPSQSQVLLLEQSIDSQPSLKQISGLLKAHGAHVAISGDVRLFNQQQVLDFTLVYANGDIQQGSISYPSLPGEIYAVADQIQRLIGDPKLSNKPSGKTFLKLSSESFAEGIATLEKQGAVHAIRYFSAAAVLDPDDLWPVAYLARSQVLLGKWADAESSFVQLNQASLYSEPVLHAFVAVWQAELKRRQGLSDTETAVQSAIYLAEKSKDNQLIVQSYRLAAKFAWQRLDWQQHHQWLEKAHQRSDHLAELDDQADMLFYLGNQANEGLEQSPWSDLKVNGPKLRQALNFYQHLGYEPNIAATQLAIARNYTLPLREREQALQQAVTLYRSLEQPFELAEALIYAGFYHLQSHQGQDAQSLFQEALQLAQQLKAAHLMELSQFYLAFSQLDQGLFADNSVKLNKALNSLEQLLPKLNNSLLKVSSRVFLAWGYTQQNKPTQAKRHLTDALRIGEQISAPTTLNYAVYSLMKIHLNEQDYAATIALGDYPITTRLQARYYSRALSEQGHHEYAVKTLEQYADKYPRSWTADDQKQLNNYRLRANGHAAILLEEPDAHSVYCESEWEI